MINYNFKIEFTRMRTIYSDIVFTSGDVRGYKLWFEFTDHGKKVDISNCLLTVKALRSDGIVVTDMGSVAENGQMYYEVKSSMISKEGEIKFEIALSDKGGMYVTTKEIVASVREGYGDGDVDAENTTPVLSTLLNAASACVAAAQTAGKMAEDAKNAAENAETAAENAETAAENAETAAENAKEAADINPSAVVSDVTLIAESDGSHRLNVLRLDGSGGFDSVALASKKYVDDNVEKIKDDIFLVNNTAEYNRERLDALFPLVDNNVIDVDILKNQMGDIETALDNIIAIQNTLIGGDSV